MRYIVHHAFAHDGVFYTSENAEQVAKLPPKVREHHEKRGNISAVPANAGASTKE